MFLHGLLHLLQRIMVHLAHLVHLPLGLHHLLQPHTQRPSHLELPSGRVLHHPLVHLGRQLQDQLQEHLPQQDPLEPHQDQHPLRQPQVLHQVQQRQVLLLLFLPLEST